MNNKVFERQLTVANTDTEIVPIPYSADRISVTVDTPANVTVSVAAHTDPNNGTNVVWKSQTLTDGTLSLNGPIGGIKVVATGNATVNILATGS